MGHYYSEMVSDEDIEQRRKQARETRGRLVRGIETAINEDGIASVLADILEEGGVDMVLLRARLAERA